MYGYPVSFSLDTSGMLTGAESIFNGLNPAFVQIWGIALGVGLLTLVGVFVMKAIKGAG